MCQGITRSHPSCTHPKAFLIMEPCAAYKIDKCATYPTFSHNGITIHCGFCELDINDTILQEHPRFPRKCPDCLAAEEDQIIGYNEALVAGWEVTIAEIEAPDWTEGDEWKDEEWRDIIIGGYEMLIVQRMKSMSDDLEDLWDLSYWVDIEIPEDTPCGRGVLAPVTEQEGVPPKVPSHTFVPDPLDVPNVDEKDVEDSDANSSDAESSEFNETPFEFEREEVTWLASPVALPPGPPPNTPCPPSLLAAMSTAAASALPTPAETHVHVSVGDLDDSEEFVHVERDLEDHEAQEDLESTPITAIQNEVRPIHEDDDDEEPSYVTIIHHVIELNEVAVEEEAGQDTSNITVIRNGIPDDEETSDAADDQDFSKITVIRHELPDAREDSDDTEEELESSQSTVIHHKIEVNDDGNEEDGVSDNASRLTVIHHETGDRKKAYLEHTLEASEAMQIPHGILTKEPRLCYCVICHATMGKPGMPVFRGCYKDKLAPNMGLFEGLAHIKEMDEEGSLKSYVENVILAGVKK